MALKLSDYAQAFDCGVEAWSGFWGDPLFSGGLMMVTYGIAAFATFRASRRLSGIERAAWLVAALLLTFQIANTPLDLHGLAWASGRCLAHLQGWYADRHTLQVELLVSLAAVAVVMAATSILILRRDFWPNTLLVLGVSLSLGMTVAKGVNYHYLEVFYSSSFGPLAFADLVELAGIAIVFTAAWLKLKIS